jgi:hypothetical protein
LTHTPQPKKIQPKLQIQCLIFELPGPLPSFRDLTGESGEVPHCAAVTSNQSLIKEPERRQIMSDLAQARQAIRANRPQGGKILHQAFSNLLKLWSEV